MDWAEPIRYSKAPHVPHDNDRPMQGSREDRWGWKAGMGMPSGLWLSSRGSIPVYTYSCGEGEWPRLEGLMLGWIAHLGTRRDTCDYCHSRYLCPCTTIKTPMHDLAPLPYLEPYHGTRRTSTPLAKYLAPLHCSCTSLTSPNLIQR